MRTRSSVTCGERKNDVVSIGVSAPMDPDSGAVAIMHGRDRREISLVEQSTHAYDKIPLNKAIDRAIALSPHGTILVCMGRLVDEECVHRLVRTISGRFKKTTYGRRIKFLRDSSNRVGIFASPGRIEKARSFLCKHLVGKRDRVVGPELQSNASNCGPDFETVEATMIAAIGVKQHWEDAS